MPKQYLPLLDQPIALYRYRDAFTLHLSFSLCRTCPARSSSLSLGVLVCSFYTFSHRREVKEIIIVCDPSYKDVFEG